MHTHPSPRTPARVHAWLATLLLALVLLGGPARGANTLELAACAGKRPGEKRTLAGMVRVHVVCDRVLFEIPPAVLGRDMLVYTEFSQVWATDSDIVPGAAVDKRMMRWHRRGDTVHLEVTDLQMRAGNLPALERGIRASQLAYLVRSFEIIGEGADGAPIVDATPLYVEDAPAFALDFKRRLRMVKTDPQRSYVRSVKVFPTNVQVRFFQTWVPDPEQLYRPPASGEAQVQPSVQFVFSTNMLLLPREPMRGRYWDPRVGYFSEPFDDYGTEFPWRVPRAFITRYRLEKKDPAAALSEPVQPIVFYLSPEIPARWRPYIKRGVEDWRTVFEAAGFRNAIAARDAPLPERDPGWDPEDARHSVIRWVPSARQKALGPSLVDPRSGEVVSSHLILWHDVLRLVQSWYFIQAGAVDPRAARLPLPDELTGELLRYVVAHELGHALGLRHNFKAASAYSVGQLRNPEWTLRWGTTASIMSYGRINYVAQPGDGAGLLPRFGPYDFFAIEWGYKPLPGPAPEDEWAALDRLAARQVEEPLLRFGEEDEAGEVDPGVTTYVLGSDPIAAADLGLRNVDRVMGILVAAATHPGRDYDLLSDLYQALVLHRHRQLDAVARLVGGVEEIRYQARRGGLPFVPVDPERARAAVRFLSERAFATPARLLDADVLQRIVPSGASDPLQGSNIELLERLLDPPVFQRLAEATLVAPDAMPYLGPELLRDLNDGLFEELAHAPVEIGFYRRELQRNYVQLLVSFTHGKPQRRQVPQDQQTRIPERRIPDDARMPGLYSQLAASARDMRTAPDRPSEFGAAVRAAAADLSQRIREATERTRDRVTAAHLAELLRKLEQVR